MVTHLETHTELLLAARTAHGRRDWHASYEAFTRAGQDTPLRENCPQRQAQGSEKHA